MIGGGRPEAIRVFIGVASAFGLVVALAGSGCKEGKPPYDVIPPDGSPETFLPPTGIHPGVARTVGSIYHFDPARFRLFPPLSGTDPRFVRRDSVLTVARAGNAGAPLALRLRPDEADPELAVMYSNPLLFGFEADLPANVGFHDGRRATNASDYFPTQTGNTWEYNYNQRDWIVVDSIAGPSAVQPPTATGPTTSLVTHCQVNPLNITLLSQFKPNRYSYASDLTVDANGIQFHAWRLISERVVAFEDRDPPRPSGNPDRQRNPRFLWLSISGTQNPAVAVPVASDQCLDDLPSHLEGVALKFSQNELVEGETFTTWSYLTVDTAVLRQRLNSEAQVPNGRCGFEFAVGPDTLRMFPTRTFKILSRFDVEVERIVNQITLVDANVRTIGKYPRTAAPNAVVKFRVTMSVFSGATLTPVQELGMWFQKGLGPVIRTQGVFAPRRANARLRSAVVNNIVYPSDNNPAFEYQDD